MSEPDKEKAKWEVLDDPNDVEKKIIKQIEYYFGDVNLLKDKFLKEKIKEDDGWVTVETMLNFNRLKSICEDPQAIVEALKKSTSGLIKISDDAELKIRRNPECPLPTDMKTAKEELMNRSIYAKSFPLDTTLDDLEAFFEQYGTIDNIYLKRDFKTKDFKGSVFVTFKNKDEMESFLAEAGTKYKDVELIAKLSKSEYHKKKLEERKAEKEKKEKDAIAAKCIEQRHNPPPIPDLSEEAELEKVRNQMTKGSVLRLLDMDPENNSRESVKELFAKHGDVAWVDFDKGVTEGYIRLREANSAAPALESLKSAFENGEIMLNDKKIEIVLVEGEEEFEYWKKMFRDIYERNRKGRENRRFKEGRGRGGRGGDRRGRNKGNKRKWGGGSKDEFGSKASPNKVARMGGGGDPNDYYPGDF